MLVVLMPLAFAVVLLLVMAGSQRPRSPWQGQILTAGSIFGIIVLLISELLSPFAALRQPWVAGAWGVVVAAGIALGWSTGRLSQGWARLWQLVRLERGTSRLIAFSVAVLFAIVLATALVAPPNNVDVQQYHMPRVEQWTQNRTLRHFPTPYDNQNSRPHWAELAILNLRLLSGSDRLANLPQAFSLLGLMIASSGIAALLNGGSRSQWLAAAVAFSVPMAVLQSTTPKNDVVAGWWVMVFAYFVLQAAMRELMKIERVVLALSLALATLTKGTAIPFVVPLLLWYFLALLRRRGILGAAPELLVAGVIVLAMNAPFWLRNLQTYGGPYGSRIPVEFPLGSPLSPDRASAAERLPQLRHGKQATAGGEPGRQLLAASTLLQPDFDASAQARRLARMLAMHFVSPFRAVNELYFRALSSLPSVFSPGFVSSLRNAAWNHAMTAGNPVHLVGILLAMVAGRLTVKGKTDLQFAGLALSSLAGLILISFAGCAGSMFCLRYQLAFFLLGAPLMASVVARLGSRWTSLFTALFIAYAVPYVLFNNMRPVIGLPPWPTRIGSVFLVEENEVLFAQSPELQDEWEAVTGRVIASACTQVGLSTTRDDLEYALWRLLGATEGGIAVRHVRTSEATAGYLDPDFTPCAVICTSCQGMELPPDLHLEADYGHIQLYLRRS